MARGAATAGAGLIFALLGLAGGCGGGDEPPADGEAAASGTRQAVRVALLHPGRENDRGWNQLAYEALRGLRDRTGASVRHTHTPNKSTFKSEMRDYAQRGFTLVICHGSEFVKAAREVAGDFPRTRFVVTGSGDAGGGVATLDFRLWEAAYLCGVLAAHLVPGGPAGLIGGEDIVTVRRTMDAFANGARSVLPAYPTYPQYVGSWDDIARARQTAASLIETRGVKVIFQNADAAALGIFQAAEQAGVLAFGANGDQNALSPGIIPASAVIDMARAFERVLDAARRGTWRDEAVVCDLKSGLIEVVLNPAFAERIPPAARAAMDRTRSEIVAGRLDVLAAPEARSGS